MSLQACRRAHCMSVAEAGELRPVATNSQVLAVPQDSHGYALSDSGSCGFIYL